LLSRPASDAPRFPIELRYITPGYFRALRIPLRRGRAFTDGDTRESTRVIVINETLARLYFGAADPVGAAMTRGTIVGVVADVRQVNLDRPALPEIYYPIAQNWSQVSELGMSLVVSAENRADMLIDAVRSAIRDVAPNQAVFSVKTMDRVVADSLSEFTLFLGLMAAFATLALVLAWSGTYGVISYLSTSRTREFAIRVALGADSARVTRMVLGHGIQLTAIGLAAGLIGALALTPFLQSLPVAVRPPDVVTTAAVAVVIGIVAVTACLVPARRAARSNPSAMLRHD
jgi:ABC-type antimicrobial peptide transport system permease subunit